MITILLRDEEYKMPTNFKEVNLDKYMKIMQIPKEANHIEKLIKMLSILTEIHEDDIRAIDMEQVKTISNHIEFMFKQQTQALHEQINIDGEWYGFNKGLHRINLGEFLDLEEFTKKEKVNDNIHILMAILYRPIKQKHKPTILKNFLEKYIYKGEKEYEIEEYSGDKEEVFKRADIFRRKMTMDKVLGAMFFFTILKLLYIENLQSSLNKKQQMDWMMKKMKEFGIGFNPTGDG